MDVVKLKVKASAKSNVCLNKEHDMVEWEMVPPNLNFGSRGRLVVSFTPRLL
jgi:hypothetical protein